MFSFLDDVNTLKCVTLVAKKLISRTCGDIPKEDPTFGGNQHSVSIIWTNRFSKMRDFTQLSHTLHHSSGALLQIHSHKLVWMNLGEKRTLLLPSRFNVFEFR